MYDLVIASSLSQVHIQLLHSDWFEICLASSFVRVFRVTFHSRCFSFSHVFWCLDESHFQFQYLSIVVAASRISRISINIESIHTFFWRFEMSRDCVCCAQNPWVSSNKYESNRLSSQLQNQTINQYSTESGDRKQIFWLTRRNPSHNQFDLANRIRIIYSYTYITRVITALLNPAKSKSLKFKFTAIGLLLPCSISMRLIRSGSNFGIANPGCPFGCVWTIFVITFGKQTESPALHCGISAAKFEEKQKNQFKFIIC